MSLMRNFLDYLIDEGVTKEQIEKAAERGYAPAKADEEAEYFAEILDILSDFVAPSARLRERP